MQLYMLDPDEYRYEDIQSELPPSMSDDEKKQIGSSDDSFKCGGCLWGVSRLYVMADSEEEARKLYLNGDAGLCDSCIADILTGGAYEISLRTA